MTDLATEREVPGDTGQVSTADAIGDTAVLNPAVGPSADEPTELAWAPPTEPARRRWRLWLWIGIPSALVTLGLAAASTILLAPGVKIGGVDVGLLTPGAAADAVQRHLEATTVTFTGDGTAEVTGAELGASVEARTLVNDAFADHPMWNVAGWFPEPVQADVAVDEVAATAALRAAMPDLYTDPVDASVVFDDKTARYGTTPAESGTGIDVETVRTALQDALQIGASSAEVPAVAAEVAPLTSSATADARAEQLNGMLGGAGFYIGDERTIPLDPAVVASWLTLTTAEDGDIVVSADTAAIADALDGLAEKVDREPVDAVVVTDPAGNVLREQTAGQTGRALGSTAGLAATFAALLADGDGALALPVEETAFETTALARNIEVNLSSQMAYLFENGAVVQAWPISSGLPGTPTPTGNFSVFAHVSMQDMGCFEGAVYCTENVPWVTYFAPDIAFHGAYWHNNFGSQMSHGCVNMPIWQAEYVFNWAPSGTPVWVHH